MGWIPFLKVDSDLGGCDLGLSSIPTVQAGEGVALRISTRYTRARWGIQATAHRVQSIYTSSTRVSEG